MGYAAYPIEEDLRDFLIAAKVLPNPVGTSVLQFLRLDAAIVAGRNAFEQDAGRTILAVTGTRTYDPPRAGRSVVNLGADLAIGSSPTVKIDGVTKTLNTDYYLGPPNADTAPNGGDPWSWIEFTSPYGVVNKRKCITVTGPWGYATTIPEDAWQGMLNYSAWSVMPQVQRALTSGVLKYKAGDVAKEYGSPAAAGEAFEATYRSIVDGYIRLHSWIP